MGHTITEKILLDHTDKKAIEPGDFIYAKANLALGNDITAPLAIEEFRRLGLKKVWNNSKIALIPDHFTPSKDLKSANQCKILRDFAKEFKIKHYYEEGRAGVEHAFLPELGLVMPGDLVIGADSHTCTYGAIGAFSTGVGSTDLAACFAAGKCWFKVPESIKFVYNGKLDAWVSGKDVILFTIGEIGVDGALYKAMEFTGPVIEKLSMDDRFSMCNMAIEAGGKSGIITPDQTTERYAKAKSKISKRAFKLYNSDKDAKYSEVFEYDLTRMEPQVALPHLPSNVRPVSEVGDVDIDQAVIGSCTNGRISDLRIAASILKGRKADSRVRLIIIPATPQIYLQAVREGLAEIFIKAGGTFSTPSCGPCLGGHLGILASGERAISTTNRNFVGRMGHIESEVYLSNPAVAAASAIKGKIVHPQEVL